MTTLRLLVGQSLTRNRSSGEIQSSCSRLWRGLVVAERIEDRHGMLIALGWKEKYT